MKRPAPRFSARRLLLIALAFPLWRGIPSARPGDAPPRPAYPCFGGAGAPAGAALTASLVPSRVSGVAPLAVYFDASGTAAAASDRPFHALAYCWDFGDPASGYFPATGGSRNGARGPAAGHVFERPGNYQVTLRVRDSLDREAVQAVTVAVLDPDSVFPGESTFCFANAGDTGATFSGCPAGARRMGGVTGLASLQPHVAPGRRLLLRRGDTFAADADALLIDVRGPGLLGAFGSGNRPVLAPSAPVSSGCADGNPGTLCASVEMVKLSDENLGPDPYASDWRVMDLQSDGTARPDLRLVGVGGSADNLLLLRLRAVGLGNGINGAGAVDFWNRNGDADQKGHDVPDVFAVQECELRDVTGGEGHNLMAGAGRRVMYLGNLFRNSNGGEHVMRLFWTERGVLSHNDIGDAAAGRSVLKMHAGKFNDSSSTAFRKYTEKVVITGNIVRSGQEDWTVGIGPQNPNSDERVRDVLVEGNLFLPGPKAQVALVLWAQDVTVRNNIFHRGTGRDCMLVERRGDGTGEVEPPPERVALRHNTCYGTGSAVHLAAIGTTGGPYRDISAANNLVVGPGAAVGFTGDISRFTSLAGNLAFTGPAAAGLASATPSEWPDFQPTAGSPAVNAGRPVAGMAWDYQGRVRDSQPDAGALEHGPGSAIREGREVRGTGEPDFAWTRSARGLTIRWAPAAAPIRAELQDIRGVLVASKPAGGPAWSVPDLPPGAYLLHVRESRGRSYSRWLAVNR